MSRVNGPREGSHAYRIPGAKRACRNAEDTAASRLPGDGPSVRREEACGTPSQG